MLISETGPPNIHIELEIFAPVKQRVITLKYEKSREYKKRLHAISQYNPDKLSICLHETAVGDNISSKRIARYFFRIIALNQWHI